MKKLRILFAFHKSVEDYKIHLDDEIQVAYNWWEKIGVNTEINKNTFDLGLEYQSYNNNALKSLSYNCQKEIAETIARPGEFHIIYIVFKPTEREALGIFATFGWYKINGSIIIALPLTEEDAKRTDQWMWRAIVHESIHAFYGLLNLNAGMKLVDRQDAFYQAYRATHPNATEEEMTLLSFNIFLSDIKPHIDKLYIDPPEAQATQEATVLKQIISLLGSAVGVLSNIVFILQKKRNVIARLAECIAQFEGFYREGTLPHRNNNPGALIYSPFQSGQKDGFAYFNDAETGWRALYYQLELILSGKSKYYRPNMSIIEFVNTWASTSPYSERLAYAKYIANVFGVDINTKLNELK